MRCALRGTKNLENKRVLITAGPTWIAIDSIRVIANIATGYTGILLATLLVERKARVTLILGPSPACCLDRRIRLLRFRFFDELKEILLQELSLKKYDAVIHSAAVSDYRPNAPRSGKISSGLKCLTLNLIPTAKIIDSIRKASLNKDLKLFAFKFEPGVSKSKLINKAKELLKRSESDFVVANTVSGKKYSAYIIERQKISGKINSKEELAELITTKL